MAFFALPTSGTNKSCPLLPLARTMLKTFTPLILNPLCSDRIYTQRFDINTYKAPRLRTSTGLFVFSHKTSGIGSDLTHLTMWSIFIHHWPYSIYNLNLHIYRLTSLTGFEFFLKKNNILVISTGPTLQEICRHYHGYRQLCWLNKTANFN